eukprot:250709-Hanusia_phi.AAC.1
MAVTSKLQVERSVRGRSVRSARRVRAGSRRARKPGPGGVRSVSELRAVRSLRSWPGHRDRAAAAAVTVTGAVVRSDRTRDRRGHGVSPISPRLESLGAASPISPISESVSQSDQSTWQPGVTVPVISDDRTQSDCGPRSSEWLAMLSPMVLLSPTKSVRRSSESWQIGVVRGSDHSPEPDRPIGQ